MQLATIQELARYWATEYDWRRLEARMPGKPTSRMISVKETMMISPGLRLAVLDFDGKRLLVSVGRGGVTLVDKVDA